MPQVLAQIQAENFTAKKRRARRRRRGETTDDTDLHRYEEEEPRNTRMARKRRQVENYEDEELATSHPLRAGGNPLKNRAIGRTLESVGLDVEFRATGGEVVFSVRSRIGVEFNHGRAV